MIGTPATLLGSAVEREHAITAITALNGRCDAEGLDWEIVREADSRGPVYTVTILAPDTRQKVTGIGDTLADAINVALDELDHHHLR